MGYVMQYGIKKAYKNIGNIKNMAYESKTSYSFWKITGIAAAAFFVLGCICVFYKMNIICFAISEIASDYIYACNYILLLFAKAGR